MDRFFKILIAMAVTVLFLASPVIAHDDDDHSAKPFYFGASNGIASLQVCRGAGCYIAALPYVLPNVNNYLSWYHNHNRIRYNYPYQQIDIYGDPVYTAPVSPWVPLTSAYYYSSPQVNPPAYVRNTDAVAKQKQLESDFSIKMNNSQTGKSTARIVQKTSAVKPAGFKEVQAGTGFFAQVDSNPAGTNVEDNSLVFVPSTTQQNCANLEFVQDSIDAVEGQSTTKQLYIKNNAGEDFSVQSVSVIENESEFNAFGKVLDTAIPKNDRARVSVTVDAFDVQNDVIEDLVVKVIGKFVSGKECSVEKEFFVGIDSGKTPLSVNSFDLLVPEKIEINGSGFARISLDNRSEQDIKARIESSNGAIVFPNTVIAGKKSFIERGFSINGASDGELIYYTVLSDDGTLLQKYSRVVFEQEAPVQEPPVQSDEGSLLISSFSSNVMFVNGVAQVPLVVENTSGSSINVLVELKNLPSGVRFNPVSLSVLPGQRKETILFVQKANAQEFPFNSILSVSFDGKILSRQIVFDELQSGNTTVLPQSGQPQQPQLPGIGFISAGLLTLQQNALPIGLVALIAIALVIVIALVSGNPNVHNEVWVAKKLN